jgi:hypothetical protein
MTWGLVAVVGNTLVSGLIGSHAANNAAQTQAQSATDATKFQQGMFDTTQANLAPYMGAGANSIPILMKLLGITPGTGPITNADGTVTPGTGPSFDPNAPGATLATPQGQFAPPSSSFNYDAFKNPGGPLNLGTFKSGMDPLALGSITAGQYNPGQFGAPAPFDPGAPFKFDASSFTADPGYKFQLNEGLDAIQNRAAATGGVMGGDTLRGMEKYAQGVAGTSYGDAFNRALATQTTNFDQGFKANALNFDQSMGAFNANTTAGQNAFNSNTNAAQNAFVANSNNATTNQQMNFDQLAKTFGINSSNATTQNQSNFNQSLAGYTTNQSNALQNFQTNYDTSANTFGINAGVNQQNKSNIFDMINSLVQTGQTSAAGVGNIGASTAANVGNNIIGAGNARAAGQVGSANAFTGGINNMSQLMMFMKMFGGGGSNPMIFT